jgi:hypothetical protein
MKVNLQAAGL